MPSILMERLSQYCLHGSECVFHMNSAAELAQSRNGHFDWYFWKIISSKLRRKKKPQNLQTKTPGHWFLTCSSNEMTLGCIFSRVKWYISLAVLSGRLGRWVQKSVSSWRDITRLTFSFTTSSETQERKAQDGCNVCQHLQCKWTLANQSFTFIINLSNTNV